MTSLTTDLLLKEAAGGDSWITVNGQHILLGPDGEPKSGNPSVFGGAVEMKLSPRMARAIAAYNPANAKEQRIADAQEKTVAKALGIPQTRDNSAFDLRNAKVGIELKTMLSSKNAKITMNKAAIERKLKEQKKDKIKIFTVVADRRNGVSTRYYYAKGVGSFRLNSMTPVSLRELRGIVRGSK